MRRALSLAIETAVHSELEMTPERACALDGALSLLDALDGDFDFEDDECEMDADCEPTAEMLLQTEYAHWLIPPPTISYCPCCGNETGRES